MGSSQLTRAISAAFNKPNADVQDLVNFDAAKEKARFLFGTEVHSYLAMIRGRLIDIIALGRCFPEMPSGSQRTNAENAMVAGLGEMNEFYGKLAEMVTPYLRMSRHSPVRFERKL